MRADLGLREESTKANKPTTMNCALVFIKPHAFTDKVKELAKTHGNSVSEPAPELIFKSYCVGKHSTTAMPRWRAMLSRIPLSCLAFRPR